MSLAYASFSYPFTQLRQDPCLLWSGSVNSQKYKPSHPILARQTEIDRHECTAQTCKATECVQPMFCSAAHIVLTLSVARSIFWYGDLHAKNSANQT